MSWWDSSPSLSDDDRRLIETAIERGLDDTLPTPDVALPRRRALEVVHEVIDSGIVAGVRHSPLGPEWSNDLDIHTTAAPPRETLVTAGWLDLHGLLDALGRDGAGRWAVTDGGVVVGSADFDTSPMPDPLAGVLRRNRKGSTLRTVLELRCLQRGGVTIVANPAVAEAAELERVLGGSELAAHVVADARRLDTRAVVRRVRSSVRLPGRSGVSISLSGVDGAGKSTVVERFTHELNLAGVPFTRLWARPGYDLGVVDHAATSVKKLLGKQPEPGIRAVVADGASIPPSRTGPAAEVWKRALIVEYVTKIRRRAFMADGLVVFDRYALDAEVTLAFAYEMGRPWVKKTLRRLLPTPDVQIFLDIDAQTASERKPDDPMGRDAIIDQIDRYAAARSGYPSIVALDATQPVSQIVAEMWRLLSDKTSVRA